MSGGYDVAQVCLNGHKITGSSQRMPQFTMTRCVQCGEETMTACQSCRTPIRGHYFSSGILSVHDDPVPHFCHHCGHPHPRTERKQEAALEMFIETLDIEKEQQAQLKRDLTDIASDNPRTQVASFRIKRWIAKAKKETVGALRDIVVDIASETAKKAIWPDK